MRIRTGMCVCAYKSRLHESFEILLPTQLPTEYGSIELNIVSPEIKTLFYFFIVFSGLWWRIELVLGLVLVRNNALTRSIETMRGYKFYCLR